jgi:hypothetical protein
MTISSFRPPLIITFLTLFFILSIGCDENSIGNMTPKPSEECESGYNCRSGSICENDSCFCPEDSYFIGLRADGSVDVCQELDESFYVLSEMSGEYQSFKHFTYARFAPQEEDEYVHHTLIPPYLDAFPDTLIIELYPGKYPNNQFDRESHLLAWLDFKMVDSLSAPENSLYIGHKSTSLLPYPFNFEGIRIPEKTLVQGEWELKYSSDSLIVSGEFYKQSNPNVPLNKGVKLTYLPYEK